MSKWKKQVDDGRLVNKVQHTTCNKHLVLKKLRKELSEIKLEREILENAGSFLFSETQVKFELIRQHKYCYSVERMWKVLSVSRTYITIRMTGSHRKEH
jgi:putative transposase